MTADLSRLSAGERRVLALLAVGHTAKSAAAETGLSVNAVNERLREARRKTGTGSSRELARLVGAQENRDEQIGGAAGTAGHDGEGAPTAARGLRWLLAGVLAMIVIAAAFLALQQMPVDQPSALALHERVRRETVDQHWAPRAEQALETIYAPVRGVGPVEVTCAATLCEVAGTITPGNEAATTDALQASALEAAVRQAGFGDRSLIEFSADRAMAGARGPHLSGEVRFTAYWPRK